jgi:hypothetical protein
MRHVLVYILIARDRVAAATRNQRLLRVCACPLYVCMYEQYT